MRLMEKLQTGSSSDRRVELIEGAHLCKGPARGVGGRSGERAGAFSVAAASKGLITDTFRRFILCFFIQSRSRWFSTVVVRGVSSVLSRELFWNYFGRA